MVTKIRSILLLSIFSSTALAGNTINVPADFATIQGALDGASSGDTVLVAPGTYFENNLRFNGKNINLVSSAGRDQTIINGQAIGPVFTIVDGENRNCIVDGFTITNGATVEFFQGGGVFITGSAPIIRNNLITDNVNMTVVFGPDPADDEDDIFGNGGGVKVSPGSDVLLENNIITNNRAIGAGGGVRYREARGEVRNNVFENNIASGATREGIPNSNGGGLSFSLIESIIVDGNTFTGNTASSVAGAISSVDANSTITNNVFTNNSAANFGGAIRLEDEAAIAARTMIVRDNQFVGNSTLDKGGAIHGFFESGDVNTGAGGSTYIIENNTFTDNTALSPNCNVDDELSCANGGALQIIRFNPGAGELFVRNNIFENNRADFNGAIQFNKPNVVFENNQVTGNVSRFRSPGVSCQHIGDMPCVIRGNRIFDNVTEFGTNSATRTGGGLFIQNANPATVENNIFAGNSGDRAGGFYLRNDGAGATIRNNTFADNETLFAGGASLYIQGDNNIVDNNIFSGDIRGIRVDADNSPTSINRNNFSSQSTSMVRLGGDEFATAAAVDQTGTASDSSELLPGFENAAGNDFKLSSTSNLIDLISCTNAPAQDIDGDNRPLGADCEPGADEFDPVQLLLIFRNGFE